MEVEVGKIPLAATAVVGYKQPVGVVAVFRLEHVHARTLHVVVLVALDNAHGVGAIRRTTAAYRANVRALVGNHGRIGHRQRNDDQNAAYRQYYRYRNQRHPRDYLCRACVSVGQFLGDVVVHGDFQYLLQRLKHGLVGQASAALPLADRFVGHAQGVGKLLLRQFLFATSFDNGVAQKHRVGFCVFYI